VTESRTEKKGNLRFVSPEMKIYTVVPQPVRSRDFYFFAYVIFKAPG